MLGAVRVEGPELDALIIQVSRKHGVDPALTKAIMETESSFDVNARRYEAHLDDSSLGLMQVLLKTARWILKKPNLSESELLRPDVNIEAGVSYLAYQMGRYPDIKDVIASYNAGSARKKGDGTYVNQQYVDKVYPRYLKYKAMDIFAGPQAAVGWGIALVVALGLVIYANA